jgi:hypothetical protein
MAAEEAVGRHKHKSSFKSKKIQPKATPPTQGVYQKNSTPVGLRPLAEFQNRSDKLEVVPCAKSLGPKIAGHVCVGGWEVQNRSGKLQRFQEVAQHLGNVKVLYHGTMAVHITAIAKKGLQPGRSSCMFGSGIYMGPPDKAIGYCDEAWQQSRKYVLQVRAVLGKVRECERAEKWYLGKLQAEGFHSVAGVAGKTASWVGTLRHSENVVYSPDQVLVERIFEYYPLVDRLGTVIPNKGGCDIVRRDLNTFVPAGQKAFAEVLQTGKCCRIAAVQVKTEQGSFWICNLCIQKGRLKIGSRITVAKRYWNSTRTVETRIQDVLGDENADA